MAYEPLPPLGQANMAASLPVTIASDQSAVPVSVSGGATAAKQDTQTTELTSIKTAVETIDNAIAGSEMQVDVITLPALPAGNNNIGDVDVASLPALPAGNNNIGDVDIASSVLPTGASTLAEQQTQTASLSVLDDWDESDRAKVNLIVGQAGITAGAGSVAANTPRVTHASDDPAVTSLQLIDDSIVADDAAFTPATTKVQMAGFEFDDTSPDVVDEGDAGAARMSANRNIYVRIRDNAGNERGINVDANGEVGVTLRSGAVASGAIASGAIASGAIASGAIASGAIAAGAIAAGATSIAENEDVASAAADRLVKVAQIRLDTPVANANVSNSGDYTQFIADNFGKTWVSGTYQEDVAHIGGEAVTGNGVRRLDTPASSAGSSGDWATMDASAEGAIYVTPIPTTAGGLSVANFNTGDTYTALTNSAQVIKASAGNMYGYYIYNPNAAATYVMIYNIAAASVTVGTSTALMVLCIPPTAAANLMFTHPITFSNAGWSIAAATTGGGNSAPATALEAMIWYK